MNNSNNTRRMHDSAYIDSLCDVVPNKRRSPQDFQKLLEVLDHSPKECTPFKGKILQHLQIHALDTSELSILRLLALCYAKAAILSRKGPNKDEGPVGQWKLCFTNSLLDLDKNLNELYEVAGLNAIKIIVADKDKEDINLESEKKLKEAKSGYQSLINSYLLKVNWATHCVCALISIKTEFYMPVPVQVLLRTAMKISSLKWKDYKKKPNTMIKSYVYSLTPELINTSFMLFQSLITVLGTNIIPYTQTINQTILRLLQWTRTSNLLTVDEISYHSTRAKLFELNSYLLEQLSLNVNLEPTLLNDLIEVEILNNLEKMLEKCSIDNATDSNANDILNKLVYNMHALNSMTCLENLLVVYDKYLESNIEAKVKNFIIQTCIKIYRDFESNTINQQCRKKILQILAVIANQPYATSTTELSYHIFEFVEKYESDREMKAIARKCLKIGLSHRPTIISSYDVYNCYNQPMLTNSADEQQLALQQINGSSPMTSKDVDVDDAGMIVQQQEDELDNNRQPEEKDHNKQQPRVDDNRELEVDNNKQSVSKEDDNRQHAEDINRQPAEDDNKQPEEDDIALHSIMSSLVE